MCIKRLKKEFSVVDLYVWMINQHNNKADINRE